MRFVSIEFLTFLAGVFLLYYQLPGKFRWIVLLIASYAFYAVFDYRCLLFILITTLSTYYAARLLGRENQRYERLLADNPHWKRLEKKAAKAQATRKKRRILLLALLLNFGILAVLKYYNFFAANVDSLLLQLGVQPVLPQFSLLLPLGISFYTFQAAGYVIDVYRNKYAPDGSLFRYALFVSFFPQLVQGPIGRYDQLAQQLYQPHRFDFTRCRYALQLMLWGYFKKTVIADRLAVLVTTVFDNYTSFDGALLFLAAAAYGVQIYTDFSGGIDIIRGAAQYLGIEMAENFRRPYFACSISEFWRRWHITLGAWMKDYLFYPLALSKPLNKLGRYLQKRCGLWIGKTLPTCLVSLMVFLVVGIWHGAEWRYVIYGLWNGGIIAFSTLAAPLYKQLRQLFHIQENSLPYRLFMMLRTFLLVTLGRYFVRSSSLPQAWAMLKQSFTDFHLSALGNGGLLHLGLSNRALLLIGLCLLLLLAVGILQEKGYRLREQVDKWPVPVQFALELAAIFSVLLFGVYGPGYNAADFIYMQF